MRSAIGSLRRTGAIWAPQTRSRARGNSVPTAFAPERAAPLAIPAGGGVRPGWRKTAPVGARLQEDRIDDDDDELAAAAQAIAIESTGRRAAFAHRRSQLLRQRPTARLSPCGPADCCYAHALFFTRASIGAETPPETVLAVVGRAVDCSVIAPNSSSRRPRSRPPFCLLHALAIERQAHAHARSPPTQTADFHFAAVQATGPSRSTSRARCRRTGGHRRSAPGNTDRRCVAYLRRDPDAGVFDHNGDVAGFRAALRVILPPRSVNRIALDIRLSISGERALVGHDLRQSAARSR